MSNTLTLADPDTFVGEFEEMDLSELYDKVFIVAINSGSRSDGKFICETMKGPYSFAEMVEVVSMAWNNEQHHLKVYALDNTEKGLSKWLDEPTIDFIEAKAADIVTDIVLSGGCMDKKYTCRAGLLSLSDVQVQESGDDE